MSLRTASLPQSSSSIDQITPEPGGFVTMLALDMDTYAEKYGAKSIRKNLTVPAWLNTMAEQNHLNFSQILNEALQHKLRLQ